MTGLRSNLERLLNQGFIERASPTRAGIQKVEPRRVPRFGGTFPFKVVHRDPRSKCVRARVRCLNSRSEAAGAARKYARSMR